MFTGRLRCSGVKMMQASVTSFLDTICCSVVESMKEGRRRRLYRCPWAKNGGGGRCGVLPDGAVRFVQLAKAGCDELGRIERRYRGSCGRKLDKAKQYERRKGPAG